MRRACVACAVGVVLLASGCGEGSRTGTTSVSRLPASLRADIHRLTTNFAFGKAREVDVYGPGTEHALARAMGGGVGPRGLDETPPPKGFYLVVLHGRFVCKACTGPGSAKHPGTVYFEISSPHGGDVIGGILRSLPEAVSKLHRLATIPVS